MPRAGRCGILRRVWSEPGLENVRLALSTAAAPADAEPARRAAVAALLRESERGLEVLLIRRARRTDDPWSGHVALPGGHRHDGDADLVATAIRETHEEVGIDLERSGELLGRLSDVSPATGAPLSVRPFCFALKGPFEPRLNDEVEAVFWAALAPLALGQCDSRHQLQRGGTSLSFPAWLVDGHVVWGMTYRLLSELLQLIRGGGAALVP